MKTSTQTAYRDFIATLTKAQVRIKNASRIDKYDVLSMTDFRMMEEVFNGSHMKHSHLKSI